MELNILFQEFKALFFPMNSFYSYRNPDFIKKSSDGSLTYRLDDADEIVVYNEIREGFYNTRRDTIKQLMENLWKINHRYNEVPNTLEEYLHLLCTILAKNYLDVRNNTLFIRERVREERLDHHAGNIFFEILNIEGHNHKFAWNILKQLIDQNIIIAAFLSCNNFPEEDYHIWNSPVFMSDTLLDKTLAKGIAENHMHLGAARNFSDLWLEIMNNQVEIKDFRLDKIIIQTFEGPVPFKNYLKVCRFLRLLLSMFLRCNQETELCFKKFIHKIIESVEPYDADQIKRLLTSVCKGERINQNNINYLNNILLNCFKRNKKRSKKGEKIITEFLKTDTLSATVCEDLLTSCDGQTGIVYPENIFLLRAFHYINNRSEKREAAKDTFQRYFWQYIKLKNIFSMYIVQNRISGKGLHVFNELYDRQSSLTTKYSKTIGLFSQLRKQKIKKFEVRVSPRPTRIEARRALVQILEQYIELLESYKSDMDYPLLGLVYHFIKRNDNSIVKCLYKYCSTGDPGHKLNETLFQEYAREANVLLHFLKRIPELSYYIVGIDTASVETKTAPYLFTEIFKRFRSDKDILKLPRRIGFTYHVGEDFRDIITGLRHVDEVIEAIGFETGDRIGHGIAIGIDIEKWASMNPIVLLPKHEYLENLLWEWGVYQKNGEHENISNHETLILDTAKEIFGDYEGINVRTLYDIYVHKLNASFISDIKIQGDKCIIKDFLKTHDGYEISNLRWDKSKLYLAFHCEHYLSKLEEMKTLTITKQMVDKYKLLQEYIQKKIANKGMVIETNPTSNLLIGEFESNKDYHITNLSSPEERKIIVTINSDDPLVFNTNLTNEYATIFDFLLEEKDYSGKDKIIAWMNDIRKNGLDYSFIEDRQLSKDAIKNEVEGIISQLKKIV